MGLDIRGYYGVKLVGIREATDEEYEEPLIVVTEYFGAFPPFHGMDYGTT